MDFFWISFGALLLSIVFIVRMFAVQEPQQDDEEDDYAEYEGDEVEENNFQRNNNQPDVAENIIGNELFENGIEFEPEDLEDPFQRHCPVPVIYRVALIIVVISVLLAFPLINCAHIQYVPDCHIFCSSPLRHELCYYTGGTVPFCCSMCDQFAGARNSSKQVSENELYGVPFFYRQFGGNLQVIYQYLSIIDEAYNSSNSLESTWSFLNTTSLLEHFLKPKDNSESNWISSSGNNDHTSKSNNGYSQGKTENKDGMSLSPHDMYFKDIEHTSVLWVYILSCVSLLITVSCLILLRVLMNLRDEL